MRFLLFLTSLFIASILASCVSQTEKQETVVDDSGDQITFPERAKDMVMYEVNVRQFTPEGTFEAFIPHLERIRNMGVDILWFMPIQPIGEVKRKGGLGSYYSIKDYTAVNQEFGTLEDFKKVVDKAHELGFVVILDWVANHTAWDHHWIYSNPEYYTTDSLGNIIPPNPDWSDIADLNFENAEMRNKMAEDMKFWVEEVNLDGFRCDAAWGVEKKYWSELNKKVTAEKDLFMLAEDENPELHDSYFHATYTWEFHHTMTKIGKGEANADSIQHVLEKDYDRFKESAFRLSFTSNHDENSWQGTVRERYGDGYKAMAVLSSTAFGMPLIYGGQEAGLDKRLRFFDKDTIDWSSLPLEGFYTTLNQLKENNEALWSGEYGARAERLNNSDNTANIYAFKREKNGNQVIVILNLSGTDQTVTLDQTAPKGKYNNAFGGEIELTEAPITMAPWEYIVLTNN